MHLIFTLRVFVRKGVKYCQLHAARRRHSLLELGAMDFASIGGFGRHKSFPAAAHVSHLFFKMCRSRPQCCQ